MKKKLQIGYKRGTIFGGLLTIIGGLIVGYEIIRKFLAIYQTRENTFVSDAIVMNENELFRYEQNLNDDDGFQFVFGIQNFDPDFDIFDNEYIEYIGFDVRTQEDSPFIGLIQEYDIVKCPQDALSDVLSDKLKASFYPQLLCFDFKQDLKLKANWVQSEFRSPSVGLGYCKREPGSTKPPCKTKEEIDEWLRDHPVYFLHKQILLQPTMFEDHESVELFYPNDKQNYFPAISTMKSINYGPINVDEKMRDRIFNTDLIQISHHNLTINDDPWQIDDKSRHMTFYNLHSYRTLQATQRGFEVKDKRGRSVADLIKVYSI